MTTGLFIHHGQNGKHGRRGMHAKTNADTIAARDRRRDEVAEAMADGLTIEQIAERVRLNESTVKTHMKAIRDRLGWQAQ